ncbi:MAG: hypothetical protein FWG40_00815 [Peptococcaceae bacterium]|nr:hypothetical protein [Peptococcaceae bacterium]
MKIWKCRYASEPWFYYVLAEERGGARSLFHKWVKEDCFGKTDYSATDTRAIEVKDQSWIGKEVIISTKDTAIGYAEMVPSPEWIDG